MKTMNTEETLEVQRQEVVASKPGGKLSSVPRRGRPLAEAWITGLSLLVGVLAVVATTAGIVTAIGVQHRTFLSLHGQTITMQGGGLYANESVSGAAQAIGQDVVTLVVGIPLLLAAIFLAARGSLRGKLLRAGALWYFTYTYLLMAFGAAYNQLLLLYVALFSASLFAFILSLLAIDVKRLPMQMSPHFARRTIAWLVIGVGAVLALLWLGRIVPALVTGAVPFGLESYSTLFVQAGDLGLVVPLAVLTGALLLGRHPVGYLLAGVVLVKGATLGLALIAMMVTMAVAGVAASPVEAVFFVAMAVVCIMGTVHLLSCLPSRRAQ
jgi:hypothetical protein